MGPLVKGNQPDATQQQDHYADRDYEAVAVILYISFFVGVKVANRGMDRCIGQVVQIPLCDAFSLQLRLLQ
jgi:hypothetical protein